MIVLPMPCDGSKEVLPGQRNFGRIYRVYWREWKEMEWLDTRG
jgi:hypothetical protein